MESYNNTRSGRFEFNVVDDGGGVLLNSLEIITPGGRTSQEIVVPSGSTRRVTVTSPNFDVVFGIFAKVDRKDATMAGSPEEIVLSQPGDWEVAIKSYDTRTGDYTITVR